MFTCEWECLHNEEDTIGARVTCSLGKYNVGLGDQSLARNI